MEHTSPSMIRIGNGLQHHDNGGMIVRTISCLPALTGQWIVKGGGAVRANADFLAFNKRALQRPDLKKRQTRMINMNQIGTALLESDPIRFVHYMSIAAIQRLWHQRLIKYEQGLLEKIYLRSFMTCL